MTQRRAELALVLSAFLFGTTYLLVQDAVGQVEVVPFLAVRFCLAALVLWPIARLRPASSGEWRHGVLAGAMLLGGFLLQTFGLLYTTATASAFITYLLVVLVPLISFVVLRRRPHPATAVGALLAVPGLALLSGGGPAGFGLGEALTLAGAVAFAAHIVLVGETARRHDTIRFTTIQLATVGAACLLPGLALGGYRFPPEVLAAAAATGVLATSVAFWLMVSAQRVLVPARAAMILLLEPVFAGVIAHAAGERLGPTALAGAAVILVALAIAELIPPWLGRRPRRGLDQRVKLGGGLRR